jgi:hypothetical protein
MENKISLIKLAKNVSSKVELAKSIITILVYFNGIKLSETETNILAYFIVYGLNDKTKELIVKSGICKNLTHIKVTMTKLKKMQLIYKDELNRKTYLSKSLSFNLTSTVGFYLKVSSN